ncbi:MAG: glycosyltransferase, partial [Bacteroidales bacterium]
FSGLIATNPDKFTISYIGTLSDSYPIEGLLKGLNMLNEKKTDFRLKFVGMVSARQKENILSSQSGSKAEFFQYADHQTVISHLLGSTALLLIIPDHQSNKSIITGKLFEYLASGKPVICIGPADGDAALILENSGHGKCFEYDDSDGIGKFILDLFHNPAVLTKAPPAEFSRKSLAMKMASLL